MAMNGKFTRPTQADQDAKAWPFGNSSGGHTKSIVRVKVRNVVPQAPYTIRVQIIQQDTGEEMLLELRDMIATHDPDLDF